MFGVTKPQRSPFKFGHRRGSGQKSKPSEFNVNDDILMKEYEMARQKKRSIEIRQRQVDLEISQYTKAVRADRISPRHRRAIAEIKRKIRREYENCIRRNISVPLGPSDPLAFKNVYKPTCREKTPKKVKTPVSSSPCSFGRGSPNPPAYSPPMTPPPYHNLPCAYQIDESIRKAAIEWRQAVIRRSIDFTFTPGQRSEYMKAPTSEDRVQQRIGMYKPHPSLDIEFRVRYYMKRVM